MRRPAHRSRVSHDRWLVSYADFITLLFGLFVVLYAFARADEKKQAQIPAAIHSAFRAMGFFPASEAVEDAGPPTGINFDEQIRVPIEIKQDLERIQHNLAERLMGSPAGNAVSMSMSREGLVISLREAGFFDSGSATPKPEAMGTLRQIALELGQAPYTVRAEGHTDNIPVHNSMFDSNWELSSARATGIARLFIDWHAIPAEKLSAAGYAEFHPIASNDTAQGRAQNRRVDLVVMPRTTIDFSEPDGNPRGGAWRKVTEGDNAPDASDPSDE